jgi:hypothetical protein
VFGHLKDNGFFYDIQERGLIILLLRVRVMKRVRVKELASGTMFA